MSAEDTKDGVVEWLQDGTVVEMLVNASEAIWVDSKDLFRGCLEFFDRAVGESEKIGRRVLEDKRLVRMLLQLFQDTRLHWDQLQLGLRIFKTLSGHSLLCSQLAPHCLAVLSVWRVIKDQPQPNAAGGCCSILCVKILRNLCLEASAASVLVTDGALVPLLDRYLSESVSAEERLALARLYQSLFGIPEQPQLLPLLPKLVHLTANDTHATKSLTETVMNILRRVINTLGNDSVDAVTPHLDWVVQTLSCAPPVLEVATLKVLQVHSLFDKAIGQRKQALALVQCVLNSAGVGTGFERETYQMPSNPLVLRNALRCLTNLACHDRLAQRICAEGGNGLFAYLFQLSTLGHTDEIPELALSLVRNLCIDLNACSAIIAVGLDRLLALLKSGNLLLRTETAQILLNVIMQDPVSFSKVHLQPEFLNEVVCSLTVPAKDLQLCSLLTVQQLLSLDTKRMCFASELLHAGIMSALAVLIYQHPQDYQIGSTAVQLHGRLQAVQSQLGASIDPWQQLESVWKRADGQAGRRQAGPKSEAKPKPSKRKTGKKK
ncbi:hypothetical protein HDV03_002722 [Kappamyces sp. JEL0829]|nr:hypothetical protein HDV03_002722 [Kappamyces sp. JEL0829]